MMKSHDWLTKIYFNTPTLWKPGITKTIVANKQTNLTETKLPPNKKNLTYLQQPNKGKQIPTTSPSQHEKEGYLEEVLKKPRLAGRGRWRGITHLKGNALREMS